MLRFLKDLLAFQSKPNQRMKGLLAFTFLFLLLSCDDSDFGLKSNSADSKIIIETREVLEPNSRRLTLFCKTVEIYPCENYSILTDEQTDKNAFEITFTAIGESTICLTALGPATTSIDLNSVPNGEYDIELNHALVKNKGTLKITDTDISLRFGQLKGIDFVRTNTKRVPNNTYWGTIGYHVESSSDLAEEFIQKFKDAGAIFSKQPPGHYFYYEIDDEGEMVKDLESSGYYFMKKLIFQYEGDESILRELVQVEGKNYKETLAIGLETSRGERLYNWGN